MDGTELKLLMLMLQMRGQFDRKGGTMVFKGMQTEGILYSKHQKNGGDGVQLLLLRPSVDNTVDTSVRNSERRFQSVPSSSGVGLGNPRRENIYMDSNFD